MRLTITVVLLALMALTAPAWGDPDGLVPILCANGYKPMPGESASFNEYANGLAEIILNDTSLELQPVVVETFGDFVEYMAYPQTYVGVVSLYQQKVAEGQGAALVGFKASISEDLQAAMIEIFDRGVGLIGIGDVAFGADLSRDVFPVFANMTSPGQLGIVDGKLLKGHSYVISDATHPIAEGLPDEMFFSDVELYWCDAPGPSPPVPPEGEAAFVYETKESNSGYEDQMVPAVIAYERVGRSVTLPAFGLTERGGPDDYSGVVYDPNFQRLFRNSIEWAAARGRETSEQRMQEAKAKIDELEDRKSEIEEEASDWRRKRSQQRMIRLAVLTALGLVGIGVVYWLTFAKAED